MGDSAHSYIGGSVYGNYLLQRLSIAAILDALCSGCTCAFWVQGHRYGSLPWRDVMWLNAQCVKLKMGILSTLMIISVLAAVYVTDGNGKHYL